MFNNEKAYLESYRALPR